MELLKTVCIEQDSPPPTMCCSVLSDREIRTLATRLYDLPLDLHTLTALESKFTNCSSHIKPELWMPGFSRVEETYYDKNMVREGNQIIG